MSITAWVGAPGDCKTYSMVKHMHWGWRRGRPTYTQFAVEGFGRLYRVADMEHKSMRGAQVGLDEVARLFPAREWQEENDVESHVFEVHRHYGQDVHLAFQHPMQISTALRRLIENWIYCYRVSLFKVDVTSIKKAKGEHIYWWEYPLAVRHEHYTREQMNPDFSGPKSTELAEGRVPTKYRLFDKHVANLYDTSERVEHERLTALIEEYLEGAEERLAQTWHVVDGKSQSGTVLMQRMRDLKGTGKGKKVKRGDAEIALPDSPIDMSEMDAIIALANPMPAAPVKIDLDAINASLNRKESKPSVGEAPPTFASEYERAMWNIQRYRRGDLRVPEEAASGV